MKKIFRELDRSCISRIIEEGAKMSLVPVLLLLHYLLTRSNPFVLLAAVAIFAYLAVVIPGRDSRTRPTAFFSSLLNRNIVYGYNHFPYMLLMALLIVSGTASLMLVEVTSIWMGLYFWGTVGTTLAFLVNLIILLYGVMTNTTPSEMFQSHKHHYLWNKIDYLPHKNIVIRVYKNPHRKDTKSNLSYYLSYKAEQ
jgi:hypothetical protein